MFFGDICAVTKLSCVGLARGGSGREGTKAVPKYNSPVDHHSSPNVPLRSSGAKVGF